MQMPVKRRTRQSGATLIEVLVAILVFSFGILGMVGMQARAVQFSVDAEDRTRAALIANEMVTTMWTLGTTTPDAAVVDAWETRVADAAAAGISNATGAVSAPDADGTVTVTVTWRNPSQAASDADHVYETKVALP